MSHSWIIREHPRRSDRNEAVCIYCRCKRIGKRPAALIYILESGHVADKRPKCVEQP